MDEGGQESSREELPRREESAHESAEEPPLAPHPAADFRAFFERYWLLVCTVIRRVLPAADHDLIESLAQEAFLRFWQSLKRKTPDTPVAYLTVVARHVAIDWLRHNAPIATASLDAEYGLTLASAAPSPDDVARSSELGRRIADALALLTPRQRACWLLRHVSGLSVSDVAERVGITTTCARQHLKNAQRRLRALLADVAREEGIRPPHRPSTSARKPTKKAASGRPKPHRKRAARTQRIPPREPGDSVR